jgi:hypothetical protein
MSGESDGDRIQSPKRCVLKYKQDGALDKIRAMANVQKHNISVTNYICEDSDWIQIRYEMVKLGPN